MITLLRGPLPSARQNRTVTFLANGRNSTRTQNTVERSRMAPEQLYGIQGHLVRWVGDAAVPALPYSANIVEPSQWDGGPAQGKQSSATNGFLRTPLRGRRADCFWR